ncbi:hypothetical protein ACFFIY_10760 [Bhargavaea ullalensis]|uniref:Stage III sporulation protein AE n=1 Tax=Bhargavaea ullalensis TaxID=1265685 RepID=A0ABV2G949_9BACL
MWDIVHAAAAPVIRLFQTVLILCAAGLAADFLFPSFREWTRTFLFIAVGTMALGPAVEALRLLDGLTGKMTGLFLGVYPLLTAGMATAGGALTLAGWNPAVFLFVQGAVVLGGKWLIPLLTASFLFDYLSRLVPDVPFTRMAEMIRVTIIGAVSVIAACYTLFITSTGIMAWAGSGAAGEPLKVLLRQNIPIVGSFVTDALGVFGKYSAGTAAIAGGWLIGTILVVCLIPAAQVLLTAFFYKWLAALSEPFANEELSGLFDDLGKTMFVLCGITFIVAFAVFYTVLLAVILIKVIAGTG